jgi:hypothetical protein
MEAIDRNDEQTAKNLIDIYNFRPTTDIWPLHNLYSDRQILKYELYMLIEGMPKMLWKIYTNMPRLFEYLLNVYKDDYINVIYSIVTFFDLDSISNEQMKKFFIYMKDLGFVNIPYFVYEFCSHTSIIPSNDIGKNIYIIIYRMVGFQMQ